MRSVTRSFRLPWLLADALAEKAKECGYDNVNQFVIGTLFYTFLYRGRHTLSVNFVNSSAKQQDDLLKDLFAAWKRGDMLKESKYSLVVRRIAKRLKLPPEVVAPMVADAIKEDDDPEEKG